MENIYIECHKKLTELSHKIRHKVKQNLNEQGFAWNQFNVIKNIYPGESLTLSEISERISKKNSNVTQIVDSLEEQGIVRRQPDNKDRRVIRVELTDEGVEKREQIIKNYEQFIQTIYSLLNEQEIQNFLKIADIFLNKIK